MQRKQPDWSDYKVRGTRYAEKPKNKLTSLEPVAIVDSSSLRDASALPGPVGIFPRVGESIMHQALPVPDWRERSVVRRDRAAIMSREF